MSRHIRYRASRTDSEGVMESPNMSRSQTPASEAERLENLWRGEFGDNYTERNRKAGALRSDFWSSLLDRYRTGTVLEVGCNVGSNLQHIAPKTTVAVGVDINRDALRLMLDSVPGAYGVETAARCLPFRSEAFDLTVTAGVLIHQPEESLPNVMDELVRCSAGWVLCAEYRAAETTEVAYRGVEGALFKRDYKRLFLDRHDLTVIEEGFLGPDDGFDDVTWYLFEKPNRG